jgi:hypothetical protein
MKSSFRVLLAFLVPAVVAAAVFFPSRASRKRAAVRSPAETAVGPDVDRYGRTPAERRAVAAAAVAFEKQKGVPALRVAEDDDATPSEDRDDLQDLYGTYHPYFARGDLNGDGRIDFAQAFVENGPEGWFHVAVFFGTPDGGFDPPVWVEHAVSLAGGDLSIERDLVIVVPDLSLDEARRWRWNTQERRFVDADAMAPGDPDDVAPDEKPRVRT